MENLINLLRLSQDEIRNLRRDNELMSARLEMFDAIQAMLHTDLARKNYGMTEDLVFKIEKSIEEYNTQPSQEVRIIKNP
jgi:hypothetical protein